MIKYTATYTLLQKEQGEPVVKKLENVVRDGICPDDGGMFYFFGLEDGSRVMVPIMCLGDMTFSSERMELFKNEQS